MQFAVPAVERTRFPRRPRPRRPEHSARRQVDRIRQRSSLAFVPTSKTIGARDAAKQAKPAAIVAMSPASLALNMTMCRIKPNLRSRCLQQACASSAALRRRSSVRADAIACGAARSVRHGSPASGVKLAASLPRTSCQWRKGKRAASQAIRAGQINERRTLQPRPAIRAPQDRGGRVGHFRRRRRLGAERQRRRDAVRGRYAGRRPYRDGRHRL